MDRRLEVVHASTHANLDLQLGMQSVLANEHCSKMQNTNQRVEEISVLSSREMPKSANFSTDGKVLQVCVCMVVLLCKLVIKANLDNV